ncbi:MAG: hypothetical protein ACK4Y4_06065 [Brevundimonas sp.]
MLLEPALGDWRVITDDPGNAVLAVETSSINGPPSRRVVTTAAASRETLEAGRYVIARVTIDCHMQESTLVAADVKSLDGDLLGSLNPDDLDSKTAPTNEGSPSAVALACDGIPVSTPSFTSDVEFIAWAVEHLPIQ